MPDPPKAAHHLSGLEDDEEDEKDKARPRLIYSGARPSEPSLAVRSGANPAVRSGANPAARSAVPPPIPPTPPPRPAAAPPRPPALPPSISGRAPTIQIEADLATLAVVSEGPARASLPEGVPADVPAHLAAMIAAAGTGDPNQTRIMANPALIQPLTGQAVRPTGVHPRIASAPQPSAPRPPSVPRLPSVQVEGEDDNPDRTRIVSSINLAELQDPRARAPRATASVVPSGPQAAATSRPMTALNPAVVTSRPMTALNPAVVTSRPMAALTPAPAPAAPAANQKQAPVKQVKATSRAKATPLDPSRLMTLQEMAERRAAEEGTEPPGFALDPLGGNHEEGAPHQPEPTMIGRFLGLIGVAAAPAPPPERDLTTELWEVVHATAFLDGVNPQFIGQAIDSGDLRLLSLGRDMLINEVFSEGRALLVREGQLALARFHPAVLETEQKAQAQAQAQRRAGDRRAEKQEFNRRQEVGPLIRLCETNLALFVDGDLVGLNGGAEGEGIAVYSVTPVKVLSIARSRLEQWRRIYQFFADRVRRAADAARQRIDANSGARSLVADFFLRNGLSIAMTLRVREIDKCIECYECEKACEKRYGAKRFSINGRVLGGLDFVDCCRTCVDQRCIDPCAYDAIKFDEEKKEVLIIEEACTGCSMCAQACPYNAIQMHELDETPLLQLRLNKEGKLAFGDNAPRKAQIRRIANKCDHCVSYEDQACISACPTVALLEIPPEAAFIERTAGMAEAARGGFEQEAVVDAEQLFNPKKFFQGMEVEDKKGRMVERRLNISALWVLGLLAFALCLVEILLRQAGSPYTVMYYYQTHFADPVLEPEVALDNLRVKPGEPFAIDLGWIGTVLMAASTLYSPRKWIPGLRRLGSQRAWFDFHVWAGTIGPLFILLHSVARLDTWVSFAVWSMIITVVSGLVGRYLSTELPELASQAALHVLELDRQLAVLKNKHAGVAAADRYYEAARRRFTRVSAPELSGPAASLLAVTTLLQDEAARLFRGFTLGRLLAPVKDRKARREAVRLTTRLLLLERRRLLLPRIGPIFKEWKIIHIPFATLLAILATVHIVHELK